MAKRQVQLIISGMSCANCALGIENALREHSAVSAASVNFASETASVSYDDSQLSEAQLLALIKSRGYHATLGQFKEATFDNKQRNAFRVGVACTVPLFLISMGRDFDLLAAWSHAPWVNWLFWVLATPVQFYTGSNFYRGAYRSLQHGTSNMDVLVAMGSSIAYGYSVALLFWPVLGQHVYFETAAVIITLISSGKILEAKTKGKTGAAIHKLMDLRPKTAIRIVDNQEQEIAASEVQVGDRLRIRPGQHIPVDGIVVDGESCVDESMLSGEPLPVDKQKQSPLTAGTINLQGLLEMQATKVGKETVLAQIIQLVQDAQGSKAPIQALADRIAAIFVPTVLIIAGSVFVVWWSVSGEFVPAMIRLIAVLIIACPCALGLATPTALMAGIGKASEHGILFKNGSSLEMTAQTTCFLIDKTGTLTLGRPTVTDILPFSDSLDAPQLLSIAAAVEQGSEHPLGKAIVTAAGLDNLPLATVSRFQTHSGHGVEGNLHGTHYRIGKPSWFDTQLTARQRAILLPLQHQGKSIMIVAEAEQPIGIIALSDPIKPDSAAAIKQLGALGITVTMLTGDHAQTANSIATAAGISHVIADILPVDKASIVRQLQQQQRVAMIGDGINDAPALAQADVGMAMGSGTDIAMESADVVLVSGSLSRVPLAVQISRSTMTAIRQNLFWAFIYNIILIPIAAGALAPLSGAPQFLRHFHPMLAALAMSLSSVTVVANSLRLYRRKL